MTNDKVALRARCRAKRDAQTPNRPAAARDLARHVLEAVTIPGGAAVSGYWPMGSEMDPRPLMEALRERGHRLCLPAVEARAVPLSFRAWAPGEALDEAVFGTQEPAAGAAVVTPDVLLVPLLAFDATGHRLGYGGGYYDRTLAGLADRQPTAIGIAFAFQEMAAVPRDEHDWALDWIATEEKVMRCG
jgi:5-formyltetrahydrofolate cyclo-ligase